MNEREYLVSLSSFIPFGPARISLLLSYFGSAKKTWLAPDKTLYKLGIGETRTQKFIQYRDNFNYKTYFNQLNKLEISFLIKTDKNYPQNLIGLDGSPTVLYVKGEPEILNERSVAVVGTRKMTSYGRDITKIFCEGLVGADIVVVSGLARGVDTTAHICTLNNKGKTVAILGNGLDSIYPPENKNLFSEILKSGGCVVSEYPLGYPAFPANFVNRNRIISGMSDATLVIEGAQQSGTLLTASHAAEQGRVVFAVPGPITSPMSQAPLYLIKNGAKIATSPKDILEELGWQEIIEKKIIEKLSPSGPEEEKIIKVLELESLHVDEIARISRLESSQVSARLTIMEMKGLVKSLGQGVYRKT